MVKLLRCFIKNEAYFVHFHYEKLNDYRYRLTGLSKVRCNYVHNSYLYQPVHVFIYFAFKNAADTVIVPVIKERNDRVISVEA